MLEATHNCMIQMKYDPKRLKNQKVHKNINFSVPKCDILVFKIKTGARLNQGYKPIHVGHRPEISYQGNHVATD